MEGRRSSDQKFCFGFPSEFVGNVFPRDNEVVSHAQFLRRKNTSLGIWKQNTPDNVVSKVVADNICAIWNKTEIPQIDSKSVENKVERILARAKKVLKLDQSRRNESELAKIWGGLFDISRCPHRELKLCDCPNCDTPHPPLCDCSLESKVPEDWKDFLWDQRSSRQQCLAGLDWKRAKMDQDEEEREKVTAERRHREEESLVVSKLKSDQDGVDEKADYDDLVDSQGVRLSQGLVLDDDEEEGFSDWEDGGDRGLGGEGDGDVREYNTLSLPRFSRELDRYKQSNRAGAKIGNALLKDVGVVHEDNLQLLLCPAKVMRQRDKFGGIAAEAHDDKPPPGMLKLF